MIKRLGLALAIWLLTLGGAYAQTVIYYQQAPGAGFNPIPVSAANPLPISGTISATTTGFAPGASYANLTSTASSARAALPTGTVVAAFNTGTTAVSCALGNGSVTAVANENVIQASSWFAFTVASNADLACINQAGDAASNVVVMSGGSGLATGSGGGGGGAGGGAVYGPTAAGSAAANPPVLLGGTANGTGTGNVENAKVDASGNVYTLAAGLGTAEQGLSQQAKDEQAKLSQEQMQNFMNSILGKATSGAVNYAESFLPIPHGG